MAGNCADVIMMAGGVESDSRRACLVFFHGGGRHALVVIRLAHSINIVRIRSEFEHEFITNLEGSGLDPVGVKLGVTGRNGPSRASADVIGRCSHAVKNGKGEACPKSYKTLHFYRSHFCVPRPTQHQTLSPAAASRSDSLSSEKVNRRAAQSRKEIGRAHV